MGQELSQPIDNRIMDLDASQPKDVSMQPPASHPIQSAQKPQLKETIPQKQQLESSSTHKSVAKPSKSLPPLAPSSSTVPTVSSSSSDSLTASLPTSAPTSSSAPTSAPTTTTSTSTTTPTSLSTSTPISVTSVTSALPTETMPSPSESTASTTLSSSDLPTSSTVSHNQHGSHQAVNFKTIMVTMGGVAAVITFLILIAVIRMCRRKRRDRNRQFEWPDIKREKSVSLDLWPQRQSLIHDLPTQQHPVTIDYLKPPQHPLPVFDWNQLRAKSPYVATSWGQPQHHQNQHHPQHHQNQNPYQHAYGQQPSSSPWPNQTTELPIPFTNSDTLLEREQGHLQSNQEQLHPSLQQPGRNLVPVTASFGESVPEEGLRHSHVDLTDKYLSYYFRPQSTATVVDLDAPTSPEQSHFTSFPPLPPPPPTTSTTKTKQETLLSKILSEQVRKTEEALTRNTSLFYDNQRFHDSYLETILTRPSSVLSRKGKVIDSPSSSVMDIHSVYSNYQTPTDTDGYVQSPLTYIERETTYSLS